MTFTFLCLQPLVRRVRLWSESFGKQTNNTTAGLQYTTLAYHLAMSTLAPPSLELVTSRRFIPVPVSSNKAWLGPSPDRPIPSISGILSKFRCLTSKVLYSGAIATTYVRVPATFTVRALSQPLAGSMLELWKFLTKIKKTYVCELKSI